ncbi:MAG: succinate dehydrogenase cytochrome b subunit [Bacteroidales bacterium]
MGNFFTSSVGKKLWMALAGIFLLLFLLVHLSINMAIIIFDTKEQFNLAAHFMSTNMVIRIMEYILFGGFLLHIAVGLVLQFNNWSARPVSYKKANFSQTSFFSKYMFHTAAIIFVFLAIHFADFYFKARFGIGGTTEEITYNSKTVHDIGELILMKFQMPAFVIGYVIAFLFLGFHLHHGFQSAFQTLGVNHKTYSPVIYTLGIVYTLIIVVGFSSIPIVIYFFK